MSVKGSNTLELKAGPQVMHVESDALFCYWAGILMFLRDMPTHFSLLLPFKRRKGGLCLVEKTGGYTLVGGRSSCGHSMELSAVEMKESVVNRLLMYEHGYISLWEVWKACFDIKRNKSRHDNLEFKA